jgi:hypothetical protein
MFANLVGLDQLAASVNAMNASSNTGFPSYGEVARELTGVNLCRTQCGPETAPQLVVLR